MLGDLIVKGGLVMYPLLLCSVTALAVVIERVLFFMRLKRSESFYAERMRAAGKLMRAGAVVEAATVLEEVETPVVKVWRDGLINGTPASARREMELAMNAERRRLFSGLAVLDTIVTAAPLLGLLGTVTGIINTFHILGDEPAMRMQAVGRGMAEALITTASGLIIAIPTLVALNYFANRAERAEEQMERRSAELAEMLPKRGDGHEKVLEP